MAGRQTVRARTKNASSPDWKLPALHPGFPDEHQANRLTAIEYPDNATDILTSKRSNFIQALCRPSFLHCILIRKTHRFETKRIFRRTKKC
jgi:hypothetical protein